MHHPKKKYNLPEGYSLLQAVIRSRSFLKSPVAFISKSMEAFSGTYTATLGINRKLILTQDPDFIHHVLKDNHKNYHKSELANERAAAFFGNGLLFSNGAYWLRQRRLIQPAFHREKLQGLYGNMTACIDAFLEHFPIGQHIDVYPWVHQASFKILIKSLFDIPLSAATMEELSLLFTGLQNFLIKDINQPLQRFFYPLTGTEKKQLKKAGRLRSIFSEIIDSRRSSEQDHDDLLDMLLKSRYEDTGEAMSNDQVIDEVMILVFAGHETTANSLSWLLYLLSKNERVTQKLIDSFADSDIHDSLHNEYLKATINEAMRLYPAAWMTERVALDDDSFGAFNFPKNTIIIPFFFGLHRNSSLWTDALSFIPERFMEDAKAVRSKNFFPFGAGPRMCIGNNFAMAEMSFFVFAFLKRFRIMSTGNEPEMNALITLRPDKVVLDVHRVNR